MGKSFLVLSLGVAVASGKPFLDLETQSGDVLYLALEDTMRRVQHRLYMNRLDAPQNMHLATTAARIGSGWSEQVSSFLEDHPNTHLVIIDTLQMIRDASSAAGRTGMYGSDYADIRVLKDIADSRNVSFLLIHHLRKQRDSEDPFNEITGSTGLQGAVDTEMVLKKHSDAGPGAARLYVRGRDIEEKELRMRFLNGVWILDQTLSLKQAHLEEIPPFIHHVIQRIQTAGPFRGTATGLLSDLPKTDVSCQTVKRTLAHYAWFLADAGIKYVPLKRSGSERPFTLTRLEKEA